MHYILDTSLEECTLEELILLKTIVTVGICEDRRCIGLPLPENQRKPTELPTDFFHR